MVTKKKLDNQGINETEITNRIPDFEELPQKKNKDILITIRTTQQKKNEYKSELAKYNLSLSRGFCIALDYLLEQVRKGNLKLKDTGIF